MSFEILWKHIHLYSCNKFCCHSAVLLLWMLQDSHHIEKRLLCPPWCVTVRVIGHSFQPGKEHFIPCCSLKPPRVVRHKTEKEHKCYCISFSFCVFICLLQFVFSLLFCHSLNKQPKNKMVFKLMYHFPLKKVDSFVKLKNILWYVVFCSF